MYPVDGLVKNIAKTLGRSLGSNVHFKALDAQWYLGGPGKKFPVGRDI